MQIVEEREIVIGGCGSKGMGTKVQIENYFPGHCSMRDLSRESNGPSWPSCYIDTNLANGQFYFGFLPRTVADSHSGYEKDVVKQKMLEHEAVFKNQVYELHRLYQVQRDLMDEATRRNERLKRRISYETSPSSSPIPSQIQYEDAQRWNDSSLPYINSVKSSPHSSKGKGIMATSSPFQNGFSPKNLDVQESRPTKFRRRMLDLQLPADEYIDTDEVEEFDSAKVSDNISSFPEKNVKFASTNGKFPCVNKSKALADLNEPLHVDETTVISSLDFLGHVGSHSDIPCRDLSANIIRSKNVPQNSRHGSMNGSLNKSHFKNRPNGQDFFCYALESEQHKGNLVSSNQGNRPEKAPIPSQPLQILLDQACQTPAWASSWAKPSSGLSPKSLSVQTSPYLTSTFSKSPQSSVRSNNLFGNKLNLNSNPGANATFGDDPPVRNGFYQRLKEMNSNVELSNGVCNNHISQQGNKIIDRHPTSEDPLAVLPWLRGKGACTNKAEHSRNGPNSLESVIFRGFSVASSSCNGGVKNKNSSYLNNNTQSDPALHEVWGGPGVRNLNPVGKTNKEVISDRPSSDLPSSKKILGVPVFMPVSPPTVDHRAIDEEIESSGRKGVFDMNVPCEPVDSELDKMDVQEVEVVEKKMEIESSSLRYHFDLNSCITEEEIPCVSSLLDNNSASMKDSIGIDLEAPVILENEEIVSLDECSSIKELEDDKLAKSAADAIVAISSSHEEVTWVPVEADVADPLRWFVDIACSSRNDLESGGDNGDCLPEGLDDFELMTLRLKECTSEEYFPKPSIPEISYTEENSIHLMTTRTRKGQARRGRQRRDFQRDILPGLTSLSRHEVTEDLQTFGGLMRATGHQWQTGPNRRNATRNKCGRGRRRSMVEVPAPANIVCAPLINTEVGLEERSLAGWGKTTRRPRRQRYPAGNPPPPVALT